MADIPAGTYSVTVTTTTTASGTLVVNADGTATYTLSGQNTANNVTTMHRSTVNVGWLVTVTLPGASSTCTLNFHNGTYDSTNKTITGGQVNGSCIQQSPGTVEDAWSASGPGTKAAAY